MNDEREIFHERYRGLAAMLDPGSFEHFRALGVGPGWRCLEVGAGAGTVPSWLCEAVGESGQVVATDIDPAMLARLGHPNLEVRCHDVTAGPLPGEGFDLVHTRWLLHWLQDPRAAIRNMVESLRPGGILIVEEPDFSTMLGSTDSDVLNKVLQAGSDLGAANTGLDNFFGRRLTRALRSCGLTDVDAAGRYDMLSSDDPDSGIVWLRLSFAWLERPLLDAGAIREAEYREAMRLMTEPGLVMTGPGTMAAWGRKPA